MSILSSQVAQCNQNLFRNVKAKEPVNPLESTMVEVEEKENNARLSLLPACPLPSAVYKVRNLFSVALSHLSLQASTLVTGDESSSEDRDEYEYVTEAYGAVSQSAKVTKHVSRVKLPATGLTWNEDLLVRGNSTDPSLLSSNLFRSTTRVGTVRPRWPNLSRLASLC